MNGGVGSCHDDGASHAEVVSSSVDGRTDLRTYGRKMTDGKDDDDDHVAVVIKERAHGLIGAETRCVTRDGRVFIGTLRCVDKQKNIILSNAREYANEEEEDGEARRTINMILLSKEERVRCEYAEDSVVVRALEGLSVT